MFTYFFLPGLKYFQIAHLACQSLLAGICTIQTTYYEAKSKQHFFPLISSNKEYNFAMEIFFSNYIAKLSSSLHFYSSELAYRAIDG